MDQNGPGYRLTAESYIEQLKGVKRNVHKKDKASVQSNQNLKSKDTAANNKTAVAVKAGSDVIDSIPHAPWPSRAMLKV